MTNRRILVNMNPSEKYNNMIKRETEMSSKDNSRNLSKRKHMVYAAAGRNDKNNSYQQIHKMPMK